MKPLSKNRKNKSVLVEIIARRSAGAGNFKEKMVKNLILITIVFIIGFGWGSATAMIPIHRKMQIIVGWQIKCLDAMAKIIRQEEQATEVMKEFVDSNDAVVKSTKNVIQHVDKLIEELANEV